MENKSEKKGSTMFKTILIAAAALVLLYAAYFIGSGLRRTPSAFISGFEVSDDGKEIALDVGEASSAGYIRKVAVHQQQGGKLYLDCYAAFGGVNGSVGAKSRYVLPLDEDTEIIALYVGKDVYEPALQKTADGEWVRPGGGGRIYVYQGDGFGSDFTLTLRDDGTFQYYEGMLSSYIGIGRWELEGSTLVITDDEELCGKARRNVFEMTDDGLMWKADGSENFIYVQLNDGAEFAPMTLTVVSED